MSILNLNNIKKSYGITDVLKSFSLNLNKGERVGLIGANGSGKTTLFKIISGLESCEGNISIRSDKKIGYLSQLPDFADDKTIYDELLSVFSDVIEMIDELNKMEKKIAKLGKKSDESQSVNLKLEKIMQEYSDLQQEFNSGVGYEYESRIKQVAVGLGFSEEEIFSKKLIQLSGGEKTRLGLIKLLLLKPDILLLDEPTNHLDLKSVEWLENYLKDYDGTLIVISHDRYFLDNVIERIVEIKNGKNEDYAGNYSYYQKERKRRYKQKLKEYKNQQKKIKQLEDSIERLYVWGRSRDSEKMFKRAKAMQKRLDKIDRIEKPKLKAPKMKLSLDNGIRGGDEVLKVSDISKSFSNLELLNDVNLSLFRSDKAAVIGDNGSGKSTLLKIIKGELEADSGEVKIGTNVYPAFYRQEFSGFNGKDDLITALQRETYVTKSEARNLLAAFLFTGDDVFKKVSQLSGGEKSRLRLLQLMTGNYNFLILDEPTNHLDLASREVLEEALEDYDGTVLAVSHDRYFLDKVVDYIYELENKSLKKYYGSYNYYQKKKKEVNMTENNFNDEVNKGKLDYEKQKRKRAKENRKQQRSAEIEKEISAAEQELEILENKMTEPENIDNFELLQDLKEKYDRKSSLLEELYKEWEELLELE